ncbi:YbaK/EbsC family protein [Nocardia sp. CDC160]|uniref:YbaK/EbsC family protein n=1 Tax=Nocardia sp. CDC160 TaxID=3112166 RepID=UPI002DBA5B84|nr:YbaK/EbsC family protein [Nocardia sp. CDC160]MEC3920309.1 YbaK/EbsC family protein [Nocardia sp. CDC160]
MSLPTIDGLVSLPAVQHLDLLAPPVAEAVSAWPQAEHLAVVEIDPSLADTAAMMEAFSLPLTAGANCVLVAGKRDGEERVAACVVRSDTRVDVNKIVKQTLDVRRPSFMPMDRAVGESGMEFGGITPIGLPTSWRLLVDSRVSTIEVAVIGSGLRRSKLLLPGSLLTRLPGAEVIEDLAYQPDSAT